MPRFRTIAIVLPLALLAAAAIAQAEIAQKGDVRVTFKGDLTPKTLPRDKLVPVKVSVGAKIASVAKKTTPQLRQMSIAINRFGVIDSTGLPVCELDDIQPATTADALAVCRKSLVGEGTFNANVPDSGRSPFPSEGKLYAFSGKVDGKPAILAHVYGVTPAPASYTLAFVISRSKGTFGTTLNVTLPNTTLEGFITGISLNLSKTYSFHGKKRSFASASCPTPKGIRVAAFSFAKATFVFDGGTKLTSTLSRSCKSKS
jgi:hypothetical protein